MDRPPQDPNEWMKGLALLAWISGEVLGLSALGLGAGYLICRLLGLHLGLIILPGAAGLALAIIRIYKAAKALESQNSKKIN